MTPWTRRACVAAALALAPLASQAADGDNLTRASFACPDNSVLHVVFVNTATGGAYAVLLQAEELIPMKIAPSGSGARYVATDPDYNYELRNKGDMVDLYEGDKPIVQGCKQG